MNIITHIERRKGREFMHLKKLICMQQIVYVQLIPGCAEREKQNEVMAY